MQDAQSSMHIAPESELKMVIPYLRDYLVYTAIVVFTVWFLVRRARSTRDQKLPPGPPGWPIIGNLLVFFQDAEYPNGETYFMRRAKEYGEIYKLQFGPQLMYFLSNCEHIREVFTHTKIKDRLKAVNYEKVFGPGTYGIAFASGSEWETMRKFSHKLFRNLGVGRGVFEETINLEIGLFVRELGSDEKPCSNVAGLLNVAIANTTCGVVFGKQYEYDDKELKAAIALMEEFEFAMGPSAIVMSSSILCALPFGPGKRLLQCTRDYEEFLESKIRDIKCLSEEGGAPACFVKAFLSEMERGEKHFDKNNLIACCLELLVAGTDSTAVFIAWVILFLSTHPDVQRRCQQELDDLAEELPTGIPCYADRSKLPYIQATLHEADRLSTAGPLSLAHVVSEDLQLFGYDFPKGTSVVANYRAIYMNEEKYPQPRKFIPERFLKDGRFEEDRDIFPFSVGPRNCPGAPLAKMEIFLYTVNLLHTFTIELPKDTEMPDILQGKSAGVLRYPPPFTVVFKNRQK